MDEKVKVIKLDTTYLEHFQLLLSWLNFATGHYQGDVVTLDKRTPQEQAPVAFFKLSCKNWNSSHHNSSNPPGSTCRAVRLLSSSLVQVTVERGTSILPGNLRSPLHFPRWELSFQISTLCSRQMLRRRLWSIVRDLRLLSQICFVPYAVHVQHFCGMCQSCTTYVLGEM